MVSGLAADLRTDTFSITLTRGALVGALAGLICAQMDVASTILWLHARSDQQWLWLTLTMLGAGFGAALGVAAAWLNGWIFARNLKVSATHIRGAIVAAALCGPIAWLLFTGGKMGRLPAVALLRMCTWVLLSAGLWAGVLLLRAVMNRAPRVMAASVVVFGFVAHALDHRLFPRLYLYLHAVLSVLTWGAIALGMVGIFQAKISRSQPSPLWMVIAPSLILTGMLLLNRQENVLAEVFGTHAPFVRTFATSVQPLAHRLQPRATTTSSVLTGVAIDNDPTLPRLAGANVLLITVDALRDDVFDERHFPRIFAEIRARGAVRFQRAYTPAPHSSFAITSLHSSEYLHETVTQGSARVVQTLAQRLGESAYRTVAIYPPGIFFTQGESLQSYRDQRLGFARVENRSLAAQEVTDVALRELDQSVLRGEMHTFLWAHYFDMHEPYAGTGATERARYESASTQVDRAVATLMVQARRAIPGPWLMVLTADHGEEFGEHGGIYHGSALFEEQVRVPLLFVADGVVGPTVQMPVSLIDVTPTVLALVGARRDPILRGADLRALMVGRNNARDPVFSAVNTKAMSVDWPYKLLLDLQWNTASLFDLANDPQELNSLASSMPDRVAAMTARIEHWRRTVGGPMVVTDRTSAGQAVHTALSPESPLAQRVLSLQSLREVRQREWLAPLAPLLTNASAELRGWAGVVLGNVEDPRARNALREALCSDNVEQRIYAAISLANLRDDEAVETLSQSLHAGDDELAQRVLTALSRYTHRDQTACAAVVSVLDDDHLRYRAALASGGLCGGSAISLLTRVAMQDRASDVRAWAVVGLARTHEQSAAFSVLERLQSDEAAQSYGASALLLLEPESAQRFQWDARNAVGVEWSECMHSESELPWVVLNARSCRAAPHAAIRRRLHGSLGTQRTRWWLRASGEGTVRVMLNQREVAHFALESSLREWRFSVAAGAFTAGENVLQFEGAESFRLGHVLAVGTHLQE